MKKTKTKIFLNPLSFNNKQTMFTYKRLLESYGYKVIIKKY